MVRNSERKILKNNFFGIFLVAPFERSCVLNERKCVLELFFRLFKEFSEEIFQLAVGVVRRLTKEYLMLSEIESQNAAAPK
jgi:hypothetical protein